MLMAKRSQASIDKEVDKMQDKLQKMQLEQIQEDYKTKIPFLIWALKVLIVIGICGAILNIFLNVGNLFLVVKSIVLIMVYAVLLYGLTKRKRWSFYLGMVFFVINIVVTGIYEGWHLVVLQVIILALFYWHRDYLNQK